MKIRRDFVTNSSSSSYLCIAKIDLTDELRAYMKEEYGKFGERLLAEQLESGAQIKADEYHDARDYLAEEGLLDDLKDDDHFLCASFIEWTNEGDTDGEDAFLYNIIPDRFKEELYCGGGY